MRSTRSLAFFAAIALPLALVSIAAHADTITTTQFGTDSVSITATGITFVGSTGDSEKGVITGVTGFSGITTGGSLFYTPTLSTLQAAAAMHFTNPPSADAPTLSHPIDFYNITSGSNTLSLFLTGVLTHNLTGFTADGYIMENGVKTLVDFSLTETGVTGTGGGKEFTTTLTTLASPVPEPSSILMLGTGIIGIAGVARRKFAR
jgi:hypothetical protein